MSVRIQHEYISNSSLILIEFSVIFCHEIHLFMFKNFAFFDFFYSKIEEEIVEIQYLSLPLTWFLSVVWCDNFTFVFSTQLNRTQVLYRPNIYCILCSRPFICINSLFMMPKLIVQCKKRQRYTVMIEYMILVFFVQQFKNKVNTSRAYVHVDINTFASDFDIWI